MNFVIFAAVLIYLWLMDVNEKRTLFRHAACCAISGLIAREGELPDKMVEESGKTSERYFSEKAIGYAEDLVTAVEEAEKILYPKQK